MDEKENLIGQTLKEARLAKGMTQAKLGTHLGYSAMAISHFENGTRAIRTDELKRASEVLGCDLASGGHSTSATTFFRASNSRGGADVINRSLQAFDKHVQKKYKQ